MVHDPSDAQAWSMTTGTPTGPPEAPSGPADESTSGEGPRVTRDEVRDLGRLRRSVTDRKVAGVAGGLARHLDVDPLLLRVAFVVLAFFGGAGLLLYGACWLLVPEEGSDEAAITLDDRSRTIALLGIGVLAAFALLGDSWGVFWFPWPLAIIALVVLLIVTRKDRRSATPPPGSGGGAPAATGGTSTYEGTTSDGGTWSYQVGSSYQGAGPYEGDVPSYQGPTQGPVTSYVPARDPRRRGPILFWFTLALIALAIGILGIVDVAGVAVADAAYPALAVGICGLMLLVGSFYGRAGGLILVGLLATVPMAALTVIGQWEGERINETPATAAQVDSRYEFGAGQLVLDLTEVDDVEALDGRQISVEGGAGRIELLVPDDVDVRVIGRVDGPGAITLFGEQRGGIETSSSARHVASSDAPRLTIDADLGVGEIYAESE
jgi:phage shock protein PspC (stress-responsive transcriptional regulator)